jgi:hypothetical protein
VSGLGRGEGGWWAARAGEKEKERERAAAGLPGGEKGRKGEEKRGRLGWAQRRGKRGKERRTKQIQKAFEFELKFEFKRETTKISLQEHEMHKHMTFPIFIFIL